MEKEKLILKGIEAALKAGDEIRKVYERPIHAIKKKDFSPLTEADINSDKVIRETLKSTRISVISEENVPPPSKRKGKKRFWLVDPLDGTREFVERNGQFCVSIALVEEGNPVIGIIYAPATDTLYVATTEDKPFKVQGAGYVRGYITSYNEWKEHGEELKQYVPDEEEPLRVIASAHHLNEETQQFIYLLERVFGEVELTQKGSALKFIAIATGEADVYPRIAPINEWDIAAGVLFVKRMGGSVVKFPSGEEITFGSDELKAPPFVAWASDSLRKQFEQELKEQNIALTE